MPNHHSLSPILGFDVSVGILRRKVVVCCDFNSHAVATFWVMSLVGIYSWSLMGALCVFIQWAQDYEEIISSNFTLSHTGTLIL